MAYNTKYHLSFKDHFKDGWDVYLQYENYSGGVTELSPSDTPLIIKKGTDSDDILEPILPTSVELKFVVNLSDVHNMVNDLFVEDYTVKIRIESTSLGYQWEGWISSDYCQYIFKNTYYDIIVRGVDGFSICDNIPTNYYEQVNGLHSLSPLDKEFLKALSKSINADYIQMRLMSSIKNDGNNILDNVNINMQLLSKDYDDKTYKDLITTFCNTFGARIYYDNGVIWVERPQDRPDFDGTEDSYTYSELGGITKNTFNRGDSAVQFGDGTDIPIINEFGLISIRGAVKEYSISCRLDGVDILPNSHFREFDSNTGTLDGYESFYTQAPVLEREGNGDKESPYILKITNGITDGTTAIIADESFNILNDANYILKYKIITAIPTHSADRDSIVDEIRLRLKNSSTGVSLALSKDGTWATIGIIIDQIKDYTVPDGDESNSYIERSLGDKYPSYLDGNVDKRPDEFEDIVIYTHWNAPLYIQYMGLIMDRGYSSLEKKAVSHNNAHVKIEINDIFLAEEGYTRSLYYGYELDFWEGYAITRSSYKNIEDFILRANANLYNYNREKFSCSILTNQIGFWNVMERVPDNKLFLQMQDEYDVKRSIHKLVMLELRDQTYSEGTNFEYSTKYENS